MYWNVLAALAGRRDFYYKLPLSVQFFSLKGRSRDKCKLQGIFSHILQENDQNFNSKESRENTEKLEKLKPQLSFNYSNSYFDQIRRDCLRVEPEELVENQNYLY